MKKITKDQINQLFAFTKKHLVEHYDIQVELVDHLANAIEEQWKENPNILFEDALHKEYKNFGVFGFSGLVEQKESALKKYYIKRLKKELLAFISVPKVIITLCLTFLFYTLFQATASLNLQLFSVIIWSLFGYTVFDAIFQIVKNKTQKKWLIQSVATYFYSLPLLLFCNFNLLFRLELPATATPLKTFCMSLLLTFLLVFIYSMKKIIQPAIREEIQKTQNRYLQV